MIHIHNFNFAFQNKESNNDEKIIQNFNLKIEKGQKFAILGPNGVGKTTILNSVWQHSFFSNNDSKANLSRQKAFLSQNIDTNLNFDALDTDNDYYAFQFDFFNNQHLLNQEKTDRNSIFLPKYDIFYDWFVEAVSNPSPHYKQDFERLLKKFGIEKVGLSKNYSDFSPGTKKKILISSLFATRPAAILIDELTNHLDYKAVEVVKEELKTLESSILLVDHSSEFLSSCIKNWVYIPLNKGREPVIFKDMEYQEVIIELENRRSQQKQELKTLTSKEKRLEESLKMQQRRVEVYGVNVGAAVKSIKNRIEREVTQNEAYDLLDTVQAFDFKKMKKTEKVKKNRIISVLELHFLIGKFASQYIPEFKLYAGQKIRITGLNGKGKSSLLKLIIEKLENKNLTQNPQYIKGEIEINSDLDPKRVFIFQQVFNYLQDYTLQTYILEKLKWQEYQIKGFLKKIRLDKFSPKDPINNLSLGEFIRLQFSILAESIQNMDLIILDEPGNFLDVFTQQALVNLLKSYQGSMLIITHDGDLVKKLDLDEEFELGE